MSRRQHLREIARQSLIARSPGKPPLRPLAALCATLPVWAESAGSPLLLALDQNLESLSEARKWGAAVAAAVATGNPDLIQAVLRDAEGRIGHQTRDLARRSSVAALLAQRPGLSLLAREEEDGAGGNSASVPAGDHDISVVALFALAASAAWAGQVDLQPRIAAAQEVGVADEAVNSILAISHALAVVATILNGDPTRNAARDRENLRAS